jgi:hypothetical protein
MIGDFQNRFPSRVQQDGQINRPRTEGAPPKPEGIGQMGGLQVALKPEPNPGLMIEGGGIQPPEDPWLGRVELVGGREISEIRNREAEGFVEVGSEGGAQVRLTAIDKPIDRMVDRDGLIEMIGRPPKPDRKLLGFIKIEGSPRYAKALRRVDAFQRAMQQPVPTDPQARKAKLQELHGLLKEARSALIAFSKHHPENTSLKAAVNSVIDRMNDELGLLASISNPENQEFLQRHVRPGESFTWASAASLMAGAGTAAMSEYDDSRLDLARSRDGLGSGINGTVDLLVYDDGSEWIFKPDRMVNPLTGGTAQKMGIDLSNPRQGDRITGTAIVDRLLTPPPKEGDPEPEPRETRRVVHNGQVGVLVPVAKGTSPIETRPGPIVLDPGQRVSYDEFPDIDLQQMKVKRLKDVDVALPVQVDPGRLPEDVGELDAEALSKRYGLERHEDGSYHTQARPLTDGPSRELAERFGAPIEHWDTAYQTTLGQTHRIDTHDPDLRRLLSIQECKDFVSGNHDRHPGNYKLEMGEDGRLARLNAYDDDETFPEEFDRDVPEKGYVLRRHDGSIRRDRNGEPQRGRAGHEVGLPVVMDREFAEHLLTLGWDQFRELQGTIPDKALNVAKQRFELLQEHARTLQEQGRLLDRHDEDGNQWEDGNWQGGNLHALLSDPDTSYMGKLMVATQHGTVDMPGLAPQNQE